MCLETPYLIKYFNEKTVTNIFAITDMNELRKTVAYLYYDVVLSEHKRADADEIKKINDFMNNNFLELSRTIPGHQFYLSRVQPKS
jgi:hypothetical protein